MLPGPFHMLSLAHVHVGAQSSDFQHPTMSIRRACTNSMFANVKASLSKDTTLASPTWG
jgi:hypothetical protein